MPTTRGGRVFSPELRDFAGGNTASRWRIYVRPNDNNDVSLVHFKLDGAAGYQDFRFFLTTPASWTNDDIPITALVGELDHRIYIAMATIFNTASTADITGVNVTGSHEVYFHRVDLSPETEFTGADLYVTLQYQAARTNARHAEISLVVVATGGA